MKNLFFSLLVVGIAFAGSAFTNVHRAAGDYYVQTSEGVYQLIDGDEFTDTDCQPGSLQVCSYELTTNSDLGTTLTSDDIEDILSEQPGVLNPSGTGIYDPAR